MEDNSQIIKEDEIDLIELVKVIWSKRWFIGKVTSVFMALGLLIAFTSPKEYETSCILIPEAMDGGGGLGGSLGGLAALAGVDLGGMSGGGSTINPGLYRSVAQSTPFLLELMNEKFYFSEIGKEVSLYDYYMEYQEVGLFTKIIGFPFQIVGWIKAENTESTLRTTSKDVLSVTRDQQGCAENLKERILVTMDWDLNIVTIEVEMQDPVVAAEVGKFTQKYITEYVTNYAVSKSTAQLEFAQLQFQEKKEEFEDVQFQLAQFRDRNQNVNTAKSKTQLENLQSKYNLTFAIYNQMAQQVEKLKLQINENTPVFTVLQPIVVPVDERSTKLMLLVISIICGITIAITWLGVVEIYYNPNRQ